MAYERQTFIDNETVLKAVHFQHIEDGIVANEDAIALATDTANQAKTEAETASSTAATAQTLATDAKTVADEASTSASSAQTVANEAKTAAESAQTTANQAKTASETASSVANTAQTAAESAQTVANEAKTTANQAQTAVNGKQDKLVSGTNIKTLNGQSILGSGNVQISGDGSPIAVDGAMSATSENPVQNKVVHAELEKKQDALEEVGVAIEKSGDIAWGVCDSEGNFAIKLDNDGKFHVGNLVTEGLDVEVDVKSKGSWLAGKKCFVLGDSLSADTKGTGSWHQKFCELTGAVLDADLNRGWFSIGGTATIGTHTEGNACCQMRAKRLVEHYKAGNPVDVIFIQNVNDINSNLYSAGINNKGANTDLPFFENQVITYTPHVVETTTPSVDAMQYFKDNIATILDGVTPMTGTVIDMLYTRGGDSAKELTITSAPTADGEIKISMKHGANYRTDTFSVHVKAGMTIPEVIAAITDWQFVGVSTYDDVVGENGDSVVFSSPYSLEFDGGSTGVTATVQSTGAISRYPVAFKSLDVSQFSNVDSWGGESGVSYWSAQKGLIEYLQKNIPTAKIFYLILPYYKVTYPAAEGSNYLRSDGSFNMEYWVQNGRGSASAEKLYEEQPIVAKYYGCASIDVVSNCSISPVNIQTFYPSNDVHPSTAGYNAWGETIAQLLTGE